MHEMSLIHDLMNKILQVALAHKAERISSVHVEIGALAHISAEHFREHFLEAAHGTLAESARLNIDMKTDIYDPQAQDILLKSVEI